MAHSAMGTGPFLGAAPELLPLGTLPWVLATPSVNINALLKS